MGLEPEGGPNRLIRAATEHSMDKPTVQILELSYGPLVVLPEILASIRKVRESHHLRVQGGTACR
jgi:hypothetical protein